MNSVNNKMRDNYLKVNSLIIHSLYHKYEYK